MEPRIADPDYGHFLFICAANRRRLSDDDCRFVESLERKSSTLTEKEGERLCMVYAKLDSALRGKYGLR